MSTHKKFKSRLLMLTASVAIATSISGCVSFEPRADRDVMPLGQQSFNQYVQERLSG